MTLKEFVIELGFQIDETSVRQVEEGISNLKDLIVKALGDIGITLSLSNLNELTGQWNQISEAIDIVNDNLLTTLDIQNAVNDAADACGMAYSTIAETVDSIVKSGTDIITTAESAADFLSTFDQMLQTSGATTDTVSALNSILSSMFDTGSVSAESFNALMEQCTELVNMLAESLGTTAQQVNELGKTGSITAEELYNAIEKNSEAIAEQYESMPKVIGGSIDTVMDEWGAWLSQITEAQNLSDGLMSSMEALATVAETFLQQAQDAFSAVSETSLTVQDLFGFVNEGGSVNAFDSLNSGAGILQETLKSLIDTIEEVFDTISMVQELADAGVNDIAGSLNGLFPVIQSLADTLFDSVITPLTNSMNMIADTMSSEWKPAEATAIQEASPDVSSSDRDSYSTAYSPVQAGADYTPIGGGISSGDRLKDFMLEALGMYFGAANVSSHDIENPMSTLNNQISNITVNQNIVINNTFDGSKELQRTASEAMEGAGEDIAESLAKAIAYLR